MSTNAVPGAVAANYDELAVGVWAEHADGSLIFVEGVTEGRVVYCIFDVDKALAYRDAMPEKGFKKQFSWDPKKKDSIKWTWHDKTEFPWSRVMDLPPGPGYPSAAHQLSAAAQIAEKLKLRGEAIDAETVRTGRGIMERLQDAWSTLKA